jgi:hypothetical protein
MTADLLFIMWIIARNHVRATIEHDVFEEGGQIFWENRVFAYNITGAENLRISRDVYQGS